MFFFSKILNSIFSYYRPFLKMDISTKIMVFQFRMPFILGVLKIYDKNM